MFLFFSLGSSRSVPTLQKHAENLAKQKADLSLRIAEAAADRTTTIAKLSEEIVELGKIAL